MIRRENAQPEFVARAALAGLKQEASRCAADNCFGQRAGAVCDFKSHKTRLPAIGLIQLELD
jgi:hypothetical protein